VQSGWSTAGLVKKDLIDATSWALIKQRAVMGEKSGRTHAPLAALGANLGWRVKGVCVIGSGEG
jgi:hypothetical protein